MGILVGGGPAPGLNAVIASATTYAETLGWKVIGFHGGYKHLSKKSIEEVKNNMMIITTEYVQTFYSQGGSLLIPDRFNPTKIAENKENIIKNLIALSVTRLLVIGGNDKMKSTNEIFENISPQKISVISVPKTIDNDIQLPQGQTTFGFHSARTLAAKLVKNIIEDARSSPRWFIVETMGKYTGHLALSVANSTSAHLAIIPEDFGKNHKVTLKDICDLIEGAIFKRLCFGKDYGVCLISEGLINRMNKASQIELFKGGFASKDEEGRIILDDAELSRAVVDELNKRMASKKLPIKLTAKKIGYELRCAKPSAFDEIYCRELGYGSVEGLRMNKTNCMCVWKNGIIAYTPFSDMIDENGDIEPRYVDTTSDEYVISRNYFWQLRPNDVTDNNIIKQVACVARITQEDFIIQYGHVPSLTIA
jgi:6-phosphofructokinase